MKLFGTIIPYILLVSFATPQLKNLTEHHLRALDNTPYHGIAVRLTGVNDADQHSYEGYGRQFNLIGKYRDKQIWPWIFFNKVIGYEGADYKKDKKEAKRSFMKIKGMDIYNEAKHLELFYDEWSAALRIAKRLGSPGVVVDMESYNNPKSYSVDYLAQKNAVSEKEAVSRLSFIGRHLADLVQENYPGATVWFLFTGLDRLEGPEREILSVSYVVKGLLDEIHDKKYSVTIVSGGELSLNYCSNAYEDLAAKIKIRDEHYASILRSYPVLRLGAPLAPWNDLNLARKKFIKNICPQAVMNSAADFRPMLEKLMTTYDYVWIYAATSMRFDPFDGDAKPYHEVVDAALSAVRKRNIH